MEMEKADHDAQCQAEAEAEGQMMDEMEAERQAMGKDEEYQDIQQARIAKGTEDKNKMDFKIIKKAQGKMDDESEFEESILTEWEFDFIGKLVDMQRDTMATRLIHIEAIVSNGSEGIKKLHKNSYRAWEEMNVLADKLDKIRGLKRK